MELNEILGRLRSGQRKRTGSTWYVEVKKSVNFKKLETMIFIAKLSSYTEKLKNP